MVSISGKLSNSFHQLIATRRESMILNAGIGNRDCSLFISYYTCYLYQAIMWRCSNKRPRKPKRQSRTDNPEKPASSGTQYGVSEYNTNKKLIT